MYIGSGTEKEFFERSMVRSLLWKFWHAYVGNEKVYAEFWDLSCFEVITEISCYLDGYTGKTCEVSYLHCLMKATKACFLFQLISGKFLWNPSWPYRSKLERASQPLFKMPSRILFLSLHRPYVTKCIQNAFPEQGASLFACFSAETLKIQFEAGFRGENCSLGVVRWFSERTISRISRENLNFQSLHESNAADGLNGRVSKGWDVKRHSLKVGKFCPRPPASAVFFTYLSAHDRISQGLKLGWSGAKIHRPHTYIIFGQKNGFKSPRVSGCPRPTLNSEMNENKFEWISFCWTEMRLATLHINRCVLISSFW